MFRRIVLPFSALVAAFGGVLVAAPAADAAATCVQAPGYYLNRTGARACFKPNGDVWEAYDRASDGDSAEAAVVAVGSSSGPLLANSGGYDTWAARSLANVAEGGSYYLIACTEDFSEHGDRYCTRSAHTFSNNNALGSNVDLNATYV